MVAAPIEPASHGSCSRIRVDLKFQRLLAISRNGELGPRRGVEPAAGRNIDALAIQVRRSRQPLAIGDIRPDRITAYPDGSKIDPTVRGEREPPKRPGDLRLLQVVR